MNSVPLAAAATGVAVVQPASTSIQHRIAGTDMQYVEITLSPGAEVVGEPGAMMYMDEGITQETVLGDGSYKGFLSRLLGSLKRVFTGESMFSVVYANPLQSPRRVAFATPTIGKILALDLAQYGGSLICQKGAFLAAERGVEMSIAWTKKLRVGFFGGEGFIMQRLTGQGRVFINASGTLTEMQLPAASTIRVDSGSLVALQPSVTFDIKYAGRMKTALFGGEGLFYASLRGPGKAWLQSLPMKRFSRTVLRTAMYGQQKGAIKLYLIGLILFVLITIFVGGDPGPAP